jgi:tripartite-type tricarboxylate transporter receptor subunit TctC
MMRKAWARVSAAVVLAATSCAAQAQTTVEFKSITIVVGSSAGGGYDTYARVLARHIGRHIPGQPSVTVQNMPGASSLKAVQYLDANAPKDGSVVAAFNPGLITESLLNADRSGSSFPTSHGSAASPATCAPATPGPRAASRLGTT